MIKTLKYSHKSQRNFLRGMAIFLFLITTTLTHAQETFYWFGGSGNWSNINKWSLTSGNSGGVLAPRVPTINDNVVFDDNSFPGPGSRNVTISAASFARDFLVQTSASATAPNFRGTGALTVGGDFQLQPHATWTRGTGTTVLNFAPAAAQTVNTAGIQLRDNINITGPGSISLLSDFSTLSRNIRVGAGGHLITNDHDIEAAAFSVGNLTATVELGASELSVTRFSGNGTIHAGTSHIIIRNGTSSGFNPTATNTTYYDVTFIGTRSAFNAASNSSFRNVTFVNSGSFTIGNNHTIENLTLAPGSIYTFTGNTTQTVTGTFTATTPDCTGLMELQSATTGTGANPIINVTSGGTVNVPNARITDMTAMGATFDVIGVDNGGNTGWNFVEPAPKTIYWVGDAGDGDWNNQENWAETSGGTGGFCIPTQFDNVIFDDNSDASVPVRVMANQIGYCHDITVTGWANGDLTITGNELNIYGASTWKNGMTYSIGTTYYRSSDPAEPLTFDGVDHHSTTYFEGEGGWVFQDSFTTGTSNLSPSGNMHLNQGTLNTNSQSVYIKGSMLGGTALPKTLILGASELNVGRWQIGYTNLTLDAGTSHIIVRNTGNFSSHSFAAGVGQTYYNVTSVAPNFRFSGNNAQFNNVVIENNATFLIGSKTYQNLTLGDAKIYEFESGHHNQIILGSLNSTTPDCSGMTEFRGPAGAGTSTITKASGTVHIPNVLMENMTAAGGAAFSATGIDLGGNTGWSFSGTTPKDLYWIGGTGNWNDAANWTENSDGTPSGGCIPTQFDNVFFNQYSGTYGMTVTIAGTPAYVNNMTWLPGAPVGATLTSAIINTSSVETISIYGSYTMGQNMTHRAETYFLSDDAGETITFNGSQFITFSVTFDGDGSWQFQDDAYFDATLSTHSQTNLFFNKGTLDFGGHNVFLSGFSSSGAQPRHLNIEGAQITVRRGTGASVADWRYHGTTTQPAVTLEASDSHIDIDGGFYSHPGLAWNDLTMGSGAGTSLNLLYGMLTSQSPGPGIGSSFNHVRFLKNTNIHGNNTFHTFEVAQTQRIISLGGNWTQTVTDNTYLSGTPCQPNTIRIVLVNGTAYMNILDGNTEFDYVTVENIDATGGEHLTFHRNSTNGGNNSGMTFETGSGGLIGLGEDWLCHVMDLTDPDTYTLNAGGFFGGPDSQYSWTKIGDPNHTGVLGTDLTLDISTFGYGTYRVRVDYGGGSTCVVQDDILITPVTDPPVVNSTHTQEVCKGNNATVERLVAQGENIRWYAAPVGGTALDPSMPLVDGATYYVTQTIDDCESNRVEVLVTLKNCSTIVTNPILINTVR